MTKPAERLVNSDRVLLSIVGVSVVTVVVGAALLFRDNADIEARQGAMLGLTAQAIDNTWTLYSMEVASKLTDPAAGYSDSDIPVLAHGVPIPASFALKLADRLTHDIPGQICRIYSDYPFPQRDGAGGVQDNFGRLALEHLSQDPSMPCIRDETVAGRPMLRYAQAIVMDASCVECHNAHPSSPKRDWKVGDVRGVLEVSQVSRASWFGSGG